MQVREGFTAAEEPLAKACSPPGRLHTCPAAQPLFLDSPPPSPTGCRREAAEEPRGSYKRKPWWQFWGE